MIHWQRLRVNLRWIVSFISISKAEQLSIQILRSLQARDSSADRTSGEALVSNVKLLSLISVSILSASPAGFSHLV